MLKILCLIWTILSLTSCSGFNQQIGLRDDNPIEQAVEEMIKEETGIIIDFTPEVGLEATP